MRKREAYKDLKLVFIETREMTEAKVDSNVQFYFTLWLRRHEKKGTSPAED